MDVLGRRALLRGSAAGALTAAGVGAAGCAAPGGGADRAPGAGGGPATAKVLIFNNPVFTSAQNDFVAALGMGDPQLKVDYILFPGQINEFRTKMVAMYAGGDIPDAQWVHTSITSLIGSKKLLKPLEEFARRDRSTPLSDFYPGLLDYFRWRDAQYALPWYSTGYALVFNKALLDRLGVLAPDRAEQAGRWTWDAFLATLRGATRGTPGSPDRTIGLQPISTALDTICSWVWQNGGDVFTKDMRKCVANEPAAAEALQWYADLYLKYQAVNFGAPTTQDFPDGFLSGRIGVRYAGKGDTAPEGDLVKSNFALGMAPSPRGKAGRINRMGPLGFGVASGGANGDAGWRWVRFMAGPQAAAILLKRQSTLPVRPKQAQLPEFAQSMLPWENQDTWLESQATARALYQPASYNEIGAIWNTTWADILNQKGTVKALLDDFARQADAMIAQDG
jgi:multiple sugar transport system substrate-binding protein